MAKRKKSSSRQGRLRLSKLVDTRVLYCGDNLEKLQKMPDQCVDLIYIDPPFNSNRNYEVFWGESGEKRAFEDRHASIQAYLDFMRPRCQQLARVLKPAGSFYYHCDWHASHYIKVMLDEILGASNMLAEIIWQRHNARSTTGIWPRLHDTLLMYSGGRRPTFNPVKKRADDRKMPHTLVKGPGGHRYNTRDLLAPGRTKTGESGKPWRGFDPNEKGRHWANSHAQMDEWDELGLIHWPSRGGWPRRRDAKPFDPSQRTVTVGSMWTDIDRINQTSRERVGYPTQKPIALLDRIIRASSNRNDIVLDAFCGCGTAIEAAEKLGRQWIGIDISPTACHVVAKRLRDNCNLKDDEELWRHDRAFVVRDLPWSEDKLRELPPFEFENWAILAVNGVPNKAKVGDMGIDGRVYLASSASRKGASGEQLSFTEDMYYPVQVKQKAKAGRPDIDAFETAMRRDGRTKGLFVAFGFTRDALTEIRRFKRSDGCEIVPMTVSELLNVEEQQRWGA